MAERFSFRAATDADTSAVLALYRAQIGREFCTWSAEYPNEETLASDLAANALFLLTAQSGEAVGVATFRPWQEHDAVAPWQGKNCCDLMRICIAPNLQSRGLGRALLAHLVAASRRAGFDAMRILVSRQNLPARKLYAAFGAVKRGEHSSYGVDWDCLELNLPENGVISPLCGKVRPSTPFR